MSVALTDQCSMEPIRSSNTANAIAAEDSEKQIVSVRIDEVNVSGHKQELKRQFGLLSICASALVTGNTWTTLGGTIVIALYNGGPPGVIYEFITASVCYWFIAASVAELASAIPATGGVYHWATVLAGPKYGRICGWFAGWWNFFSWLVGSSACGAIIGNAVLFCYQLYHPELEIKRWHIFIIYQIITWTSCAILLFCNRFLALINRVFGFLVLCGIVTTVIVCVTMPFYNGNGHASSSFVWKDWFNGTGYSSNGLTFLTGMLNGAFAAASPDCTTHLAEEIPNPSSNIPKAILAQYVMGLATGMAYLISILYSINDFEGLFMKQSVFPLGEIYRQATGTRAGAVGLVLCILLPISCATVGCYMTTSRILWALGRDGATPYHRSVGRINPRFENPFVAILACATASSILGVVFLGSVTAFNALIGASNLLLTTSFLTTLIPHLLTKRRNIRPGVFWMGGWKGYVVNIIACTYIAITTVFYCFPSSQPVSADNMNYSSLIIGGLSVFVGIWWILGSKAYVGPKVVVNAVAS